MKAKLKTVRIGDTSHYARNMFNDGLPLTTVRKAGTFHPGDKVNLVFGDDYSKSKPYAAEVIAAEPRDEYDTASGKEKVVFQKVKKMKETLLGIAENLETVANMRQGNSNVNELLGFIAESAIKIKELCKDIADASFLQKKLLEGIKSAETKHPYFCDSVCKDVETAYDHLQNVRVRNDIAEYKQNITFFNIIEEELLEYATAKTDDEAKDELIDVFVVLMREWKRRNFVTEFANPEQQHPDGERLFKSILAINAWATAALERKGPYGNNWIAVLNDIQNETMAALKTEYKYYTPPAAIETIKEELEKKQYEQPTFKPVIMNPPFNLNPEA